MVVVNFETTMKSEKCKGTTEKNADKHKKMVCYRCGKPHHTSKERTPKAYICYNCKKLTTNPNHTAATCFKPKATSINKVGYRCRGCTSNIRARGGCYVPMPGHNFGSGGRSFGGPSRY